jgi:putative oxidoreductase
MKILRNILVTDQDRATILIRMVVGYIFFMEGINKFVYAEKYGAGRFVRIGIPWPELMGPFVGVNEIIFGLLILLGFLTRAATVPLLIIILTALATTKFHVLINDGLLIFSHDSRNDLSMLFGLLFLLVKGAGAWGLDQWFQGPSRTY